MQKISLHIPDEMSVRIDLAVKARSQPKSTVIRDALDQGLLVIHSPHSSAKALLTLATLAEQLPSLGSKAKTDLSTHHDFYAWGGESSDETNNG